MGGTKAKDYVAYLNDLSEYMEIKCKVGSKEELEDIDVLEEMLKARACFVIGSTAMEYSAAEGDDKTKWNEKF